ncbi:MAG: histone deacetylase [Thermodesulfobacteriota bacterium]|nr:MAG: histone deacetylase [Thermodesulfobacteriota bacterium]
MTTTIVIRDPGYLEHDQGPGHPESPDRLRVIYERLDREDVKVRFKTIVPRSAGRDELLWNHTGDYIDKIAKTAGKDFYRLDPDTATSAGSWEAACLAVGGVFAAMDEIAGPDAQNGFALVRPPGHHAEKDCAKGFCIFNNVALGAHYARHVLGCERVLIVDWDLHHGNGTQHSFYNDSSVLYLSTHQYPYYPGSGSVDQMGEGDGEGFTVNVPLSPGAGDEDFAAIFNRLFVPISKTFSPDFILVSAGFDTYRDDPLGGMEVTVNGFAYMARVLLNLAESCCNGRILFCLEGGYNFTGLIDGVLAVLDECKGMSVLDGDTVSRLDNSRPGPKIIEHVMDIHKNYCKRSSPYCHFDRREKS